MSKRNITIDDFVKIVQFKVITTIKNHWKSLDAFKSDWEYQATHKDKESNRIFARIVKNFNIEHGTLTNIAGRDENGSKKLGKFLSQLTKSNAKLVYVHKKTATYKKTGKTFNSNSWFYVPFEELKRLFALQGIEGQDPFVVNSRTEYYTDVQHELIDKYVFGYKKKREYVKTDKFIAYQNSRKQGSATERIKSGNITDDEIDSIIADI